MIQASDAYRDDGLIVINFDEGAATLTVTPTGVTYTFQGQYCCSEQPGPNLGPFPQSSLIVPGVTLVENDLGGDRTGAVLLSPLLKGGAVSNAPFNHYSLLKTLEDIVETGGYLGYAGATGTAVVLRMRVLGHPHRRLRRFRRLRGPLITPTGAVPGRELLLGRAQYLFRDE
jgi:hypothetical protein